MDASDPDLLEALRRSVVALKQVKERVRDLERASREPIAIVGMGCRFAGGAFHWWRSATSPWRRAIAPNSSL